MVSKNSSKNKAIEKRENSKEKEKEVIANISEVKLLEINNVANIKENKSRMDQEEIEEKYLRQKTIQENKQTLKTETRDTDNLSVLDNIKNEDDKQIETKERNTEKQTCKFQRNEKSLILAKIPEIKSSVKSFNKIKDQKETNNQTKNTNKKAGYILGDTESKKDKKLPKIEQNTTKEKEFKNQTPQKISQTECLVMQKKNFDTDLREYLIKISKTGVKKRKDIQKENLELILRFYHLGDKFKNKDIKKLLNISSRSASRYLKILCLQSRIVRFSCGRETFYRKS